MLCSAVLCCAVFCYQFEVFSVVLWLCGVSFEVSTLVTAGHQPISASVGPGATRQGQSSSGRNEGQAAGFVTDQSQQPVTAQGVLSNPLLAEPAHKSPEGSSLLAKFKCLPQHAQQVTGIDFLLDVTELARGQGRLKPRHAQHASAPQHAERRQRSQRAEHSTHAGFTATVSMTARCRHQSPESCNSNSSIVSQCCATVHHPAVNSSLLVQASLSPRKLSTAVKHGRQILLTDQHDSMPAQLQLEEQLPKQSSVMAGQHDCMPAQLQSAKQLPTHASTNAACFSSSTSAGLQELPPLTTQSPQPATSHNARQPVSNIISSKSLSRASSIVAAQQAVSRSISTVSAEPDALQAPQCEVQQVPQGAGLTQPQQQAEADSCTNPEQLAQWPEPVCWESSASGIRQVSSQAAAGREPPAQKPSSPAVLCKTSSETTLTSVSQVKTRQDGRLCSAQQAAPQARPATLPGSGSKGSARHGAESCASQPQPASLPGSDSASSARRKFHAESSGSQPQPVTLPCTDSASSARHGVQAESSALQLQLAAPSGGGSISSARRADRTVPQPQLAAASGSGGVGSARDGMHSMDRCQAQPQPHEQTGPDTNREGSRQQGVSSTAGTKRTQLRQEIRSDSRSSSMQLNSLSDLRIQQEVSQADCSSSSCLTLSQSSGATQQDALQLDRRSRHQLLQPSYSAQQEVLQPEYNSYHGACSAEALRAEGLRADGLALLQEQSQLALGTQGSCSELSREGLEEDNCRLRRALEAIEQQLGMLRNQQVT